MHNTKIVTLYSMIQKRRYTVMNTLGLMGTENILNSNIR